MKNNIASFEKSISDGVTICKNIDVEFIFALVTLDTNSKAI